MTRRVILGKRNNGNYGLFISPPGVDADLASDLDLSFSSQFGHGFAVHAKGFLTTNVTAVVTASFPALEYVPHVIAAYYNVANNYYLYTNRVLSISGGSGGSYTVGNSIVPFLEVTNSSISMQIAGGSYGYYTILRTPGGF